MVKAGRPPAADDSADPPDSARRPNTSGRTVKPLTIHESFEFDASHCYAVSDVCAIQMWRGEVLPEHIPLMERRWRALIDRIGSFAILVVVLPSAPPPSPARREEIKKLYNGLAPHIKAVGTVLEDQGIKGTTGSMVMTTIMLMSKTPYPYKNGTSLTPVVSWLCDHVRGLSPEALITNIEAVRARYAKACLKEFNEPLVNKLRAAAR